MIQRICRYLTVSLCLAALTAGCAKKDLVKQETPIPATTAPQAAPAPAPQKSEVPSAQPVKEEAVKAAPATPPATVADLKESLETIYFAFDSSLLSDQARNTLVKNVDYLKANPMAKIQIAGNCDERGSDEYNLALGERRAQSAKKYLETMGITGDRLSTISYGKEKPVDPGHDEAAWAKNRRDDFVVIK
ncbi:peptidoglycan-associated lipoprotein [Geotalea uraniireducens]|uniref:Peptidoglycan-associated lipoprotein n=1 Tax=Geotalea uraniireducens TaxID=351604 RepID=A0ABM8EMH2_9BACT|nr:peptidoglycan-associated lipoprotein Pal [Geotalea uraniireducens]BDV43789.1 peptidoglycan-associated lipoprotein [Geotalea uraniireducens]